MADEAEGQVLPETGDVTETTPEGSVEEVTTPVTEPKEAPKDEPSEPKGVAKRLKELTDARRAAEQRADALLRLLEQNGQKPQAEVQKQQQRKSLKDFDYDEAAYSDHLMELARADAVEAARQEAAKWREEQTQAQSRQSFESRAREFAKEHPDFHEVFNEFVPVSQAMAEVIAQSDVGADVAYYLGKNVDIAEQIAGMSPAAAAREIGRIEARLEYQKSQPKPVSKAPAPAPSIEGASPGNVEKDPAKMPDAEFSKWFRKRRKR